MNQNCKQKNTFLSVTTREKSESLNVVPVLPADTRQKSGDARRRAVAV